ncbi:MAG: HpcH/HpaI aldolase family protein, partial [Candidatus Kariarchaeaceae archaeon]
MIQLQQPGVNVWLTVPSAWTAQLMGQLDVHSITIDMQHGLADYATAVDMIGAIVAAGKFPIARVSWNSPGEIMRILDAGALGVIAPMINNEKDAEEFVRSVKYPPLGERSIGPIKAEAYYGSDYRLKANNTVKAIAMIETKESVDNIEEILNAGIDGIYIGTMDLSLSMGIEPPGDLDNSELAKAIETVIQAAQKRGIVIG